MRLIALTVCFVGASSLTACASMGRGDPGLSGPPTVIRTPGEPAPAHAKLYADCLAASAANGTYEKEPDVEILRLTCTGAPARAFYEALAVWSTTDLGSEIVAEGRTWRYTQKIERDPYGLDDCSTDAAGDYRCTINLVIGAFLSAE